MEQLALTYSSIQLNTTCPACGVDSTSTSNSVYNAAARVSGCSSSAKSTCLPIQTKTGPRRQLVPDGDIHRVRLPRSRPTR